VLLRNLVYKVDSRLDNLGRVDFFGAQLDGLYAQEPGVGAYIKDTLPGEVLFRPTEARHTQDSVLI
jgi:hypothetical protein